MVTLMRTEYMNLSDDTVRSGSTGHGESLTDVEKYLLPLDRLRSSSLYGWGVAGGLRVTATGGEAAVTVSTGTALDAAGHVLALSEGGYAVVDPNADPDEQENIPTVLVAADGVTLPTSGLTGALLLTLTWREVLGSNQLVLLHAPWLRLLPETDFQDTGDQVVLARLALDTGGTVTALTPGPRRAVGLPAERLELRRPQATSGSPLTVGHTSGAELRARPDGGLDINVALPDGTSRSSLTVQGTNGRLGIGTTAPRGLLHIDSGTANDPGLLLTSTGPGEGSGLQLSNTRTYGMYSGKDGRWHFADETSRADRLTIDGAGWIGIGLATGTTTQRTLHVEGSEIHSGGSAGGLSFANRQTGKFVDVPESGERWVWYAHNGLAHLWSGTHGNILSVSPKTEMGLALDVARRMRVRQGGDSSAGMWFYQDGTRSDRAFVGMADDNQVGFWGNGAGNWGMLVDVNNLNVTFAGDFGRPWGASTLSLWGSRIEDRGGGILSVRSGGGVVAFDPGQRVGINTTNPSSALQVVGVPTAISATGGTGPFNFGLVANGTVAVMAQGSTTGIMASGSTRAGTFLGDVQITGYLDKAGGGFRIDHPLDPANKYLSHSFVESPEMANLYNGTVVTGADGEATVVLPDYFEALNRDHCFQLTPMGEMAQAVVTSEIRDNSFTIRTDKPGVRVNWQVTGVRQDQWANSHRIVAEADKADTERDYYLHPELHGQPETRSLANIDTPTDAG